MVVNWGFKGGRKVRGNRRKAWIFEPVGVMKATNVYYKICNCNSTINDQQPLQIFN